MTSHYLLGLDIGTSTLKAALLERRGGKCAVKALLKEPSVGLRKGVVIDSTEAVQAVRRLLDQVRAIAKSAVKNIYLNIGTPQVKVQHSRGVVVVSRADNEIYQDDIDRAVKASEAVSLGANRLIVHNITREFIVDGVSDVGNPLGLSGSRLEVTSTIIDAFAPHIKMLMRVVEMAGGEIGGMVFNPLAAARSALTKHQKELGVALVDIGFGTTGIAVYEEGKLVGLQMIPMGSGHITNDLAVALKVPVGSAESIKLHHGYAWAKDVGMKESVDMGKFSPDAKGTVSRRFIAEVIESRLAEILEFVHNELTLLGKAGKLAGGAVFTGGGAKLPGLTELAKSELKLATQIGFGIAPELMREGTTHVEENMEDPEFVSALGLTLWGGDQEGWWDQSGKPSLFKLKDLFQYFAP